MADSKITALAALTAADPVNDMFPVVDVSDTSMAASGTTKRISVNNILSSSPTASGALTVTGLVTAGSATITGALTVDTSTLVVDSTNDRVGMGTASPGSRLDVRFSTNPAINNAVPTNALRVFTSVAQAVDVGGQIGLGGLYNATDFQAFGNISGKKENSTSGNNAGYLVIGTCDSGGTMAERYRIDSSGVATWSVAGTTAMTLNSTGLGIGASPSTLLFVQKSQSADTTLVVSNENAGTAATARLDLRSNASNYLTLQSYGQNYVGNVCGIAAAKLNTVIDNALTANSSGLLIGTASTNPLYFVTANAVKMTLDASGNFLVARTSAGLTNGTGVTIGQASIGMQTEGNAAQIVVNRTTSDGTIVDIRRNNVIVGTIAVTTTATAYNTSSDYRLKEAAQPIVGGLARVNALKPSIYNWKANGSAGEGFIAHELAEVVPLAVTGDKDAVDADGKPTYQGVDLSKLVPILVAAIQELTAEVNALKNA